MNSKELKQLVKEVNSKLGYERFSLKVRHGAYTLNDVDKKINGIKTIYPIQSKLKHVLAGLVEVDYSYSLNMPSKELIEKTITKFRYHYFEFNYDIVSSLGKKDIHDLKWHDFAILVQVLFPQNLICSGLIDSFLIFECKDGVRIDPPKYCYGALSSRVNNCDNKEQSRLIKEMMLIFTINNIETHESWNKFLNECTKND